MSDSVRGLNRREFLGASTGGGFALGSLLGLGMDLRAAQAEVRTLKIANARAGKQTITFAGPTTVSETSPGPATQTVSDVVDIVAPPGTVLGGYALTFNAAAFVR